MNLTFLIAGIGFVAVAGILYYFTSKAEEEEVPQRKQKETPTVTIPVYEVIYIKRIFITKIF
jgi:hypothetical protein